jgi:ABC-2 type transport system permease protein
MNWSQLRTVLWLRWRLTRNQWSRRGGRLSAILTLFAIVAGLTIALGGGVLGTIVGAAGLSKAPPLVMLMVWDAVIGVFLFIWVISVLAEIQRSETIDLGRLLHLPVSLKGIFAVNYLASHFTLSLVIFLPATLGLCVGLIWGAGWKMIFLGPLLLSFVFMVTAWTYCLRGWLVALMVNPRKRRSILMGITLAIVLLGQLPNLYFNVILRRPPNRPGRSHSPRQPEKPIEAQNPSGDASAMPPALIAAHKYVPPLWVANGAMGLAEGNAWPAVGGAMAAFLLGAAGLARAYRSTIRFYQGSETASSARKPAPERPIRVRGITLVERRLPAVPEEPAALALACFRSLTRAPEVKMALASNLVALVIMAAMLFSRGSGGPPETAKPFIATGAVGFTFFGLLQLMFNQFGFDRDGFRALVLLPVRRQHTLLAKNLSLVPIAFGLGLVFLATLDAVARLPLLVLLAGILQLTAMFLLLGVVGNFLSIMAPYRIGTGSLKPTKATGKTTLVIFASHLFYPLTMVPVFIPPALGLLSGSFGWLPGATVNVLLSLILVAAITFLYWLSLRSLGALLQRREKEILQVLSQEVE